MGCIEVFAVNHPWESLSPATRATWTAKQLEKYDRRYTYGDVVEVFDDYKCTEPISNPRFKMIKVKGETKETLLKYMRQRIDAQDKVLARSRYNVNLTVLTFDKDGFCTFEKLADFLPYLIDKTTGVAAK